MTWIDVNDRLPPNQSFVLALVEDQYDIRKSRSVRAHYIERLSVPAPTDDDEFMDLSYDKNPNNQRWYYKPGWYKGYTFSDEIEPIDHARVTHWRHIPTIRAET